MPLYLHLLVVFELTLLLGLQVVIVVDDSEQVFELADLLQVTRVCRSGTHRHLVTLGVFYLLWSDDLFVLAFLERDWLHLLVANNHFCRCVVYVQLALCVYYLAGGLAIAIAVGPQIARLYT